jgi:hypothetical protein
MPAWSGIGVAVAKTCYDEVEPRPVDSKFLGGSGLRFTRPSTAHFAQLVVAPDQGPCRMLERTGRNGKRRVTARQMARPTFSLHGSIFGLTPAIFSFPRSILQFGRPNLQFGPANLKFAGANLHFGWANLRLPPANLQIRGLKLRFQRSILWFQQPNLRCRRLNLRFEPALVQLRTGNLPFGARILGHARSSLLDRPLLACGTPAIRSAGRGRWLAADPIGCEIVVRVPEALVAADRDPLSGRDQAGHLHVIIAHDHGQFAEACPW